MARTERLYIMLPFERLIEIAAPASVPVLLLGESGCGKEVAARELHRQSLRAAGPFVAVNCGAMASGLLESLLCGHVRGAFTGADRDQPGFVRAAQGGTLFLDEIGELPYEGQSRLLRVLQEKTVMPIGSYTEIPVDFRLICATHRNLEQAVAQGSFRQDLFFRIAVFTVRVPALRQRLSELPLLAQKIWEGIQGDLPPLSEGDIRLLCSQPWPGNIRHLRNVLERFALLWKHDFSLAKVLAMDDDGMKMQNGVSDATFHQRSVSPSPERIAEFLHQHDFNKTRTARALGISRGCLSYQMRKQEFLSRWCVSEQKNTEGKKPFRNAESGQNDDCL